METKKLCDQNLHEMSYVEMKDVNGGSIGSFLSELVEASSGLASAIGLFVIYEVAANPVASYNAFMRGWNAATH